MKKGKGTDIPICRILGVNIAAVNMEWVLDYITENLTELSGNYICVSNVHTTVMSYEKKEYRDIQNRGIMAVPDGAPLAAICRKRGFGQAGRIAGPSLMEEIFKLSGRYGYRHYFYGSTSDTLEKLKEKLSEKYPDLKIAGMESPPFRPITKEEDQKTVKRIREAHPDFVWVGLGAPKQEIWMSEHKGKISGLMIGVGAGFDYHAGMIQRAPDWMQQRSLEWLYRLIQDPKRLFKRYLLTNSKFLWLMRKEGLCSKHSKQAFWTFLQKGN